jgi:hypothetical protein
MIDDTKKDLLEVASAVALTAAASPVVAAGLPATFGAVYKAWEIRRIESGGACA